MAKGDGVSPPMCRLCQEPHWRTAGEVCPKFRSPKTIKQPVPLRLPPPPKAAAAPAAAKRDKPKAKKRKKAKRAKKAAPPPAAAP